MLEEIGTEVIHCRACPRLVQWREQVGREKRRAFREWEYWARPIPGFGDPAARLLVLGLAPAAHGGNRTGRVFTGDRSADWLYAALCRAGFANQPTSTHRGDGLRLTDAYVTAAVKCAPPDNKPSPEERDRCFPFLQRELVALVKLRVIVALGGFAFAAALRALRAASHPVPRPAPKFGHGAQAGIGRDLTLIASYHPSQQNTFTGRLTEAMLDEVFTAARRALDDPEALA
ncbi:MAG: uracil-DNA glycosylase [Gemmatimonadota bacterium]|nr:uracil-DNA glycosylase [Gemmatimonadota bacterium]